MTWQIWRNRNPVIIIPGPGQSCSFSVFCLFINIPLYFYEKIAAYTNSKAAVQSVKKEGKVREWNPTCAAEIRAWYASVIWLSLSKGLSFEQFVKVTIDPHRYNWWSCCKERITVSIWITIIFPSYYSENLKSFLSGQLVLYESTGKDWTKK